MLASAVMVSAVMFTAWALYITLVEHPARVASGPTAGRAQFRASYQRAAPWQASFAAVALLGGALAMGAVIPLTLVVIRPTNQRLLGAEPLPDAETLRLLDHWGRLHTVRTVLGAAGLLVFLYALRTP